MAQNQSSQQKQIIVPFTPYEWKYVRQLFRSRRLDDVKECVIMLSTWISRTGENTPVAISCSHVLLQAIHAEIVAEGMPDSEQYMAIDDIRSKHGYAIVRFVNYVNEMGQTSAMLKNMVKAVEQFGIPKKIVDIRHAITHQNCPDISELRYATSFCLEWLWNNFWLSDARVAMNSEKAGTAQKNSPSEFGNQRGREQQHLQSISAFKQWRNKNRLLRTELELSQVDEIFAIKKHILLDCTGFLGCFMKDGNLIQTAGQWKQWKLAPTQSAEQWQVPECIQAYWEPIFHLIFSLKLSCETIIAFFWRLRESNISKCSKDQIMAYVRLIVQQFADADVISSEEWVRILDHLLPVAKHFNKDFMDIVMRNCPNLSRKRRLQVHQILQISNVDLNTSASAFETPTRPSTSSTPSTVPTTPSGVVHTVNDIQQLLLKSRSKSSTSSEVSTPTSEAMRNEETGVELCDGEDWIDVPFGMAPGQRVECFTVVIDDTDKGSRKRKAFDTAITLDDD